MAVKPIALSFKNNDDDIQLYAWVTSHSNMSGFIKDILRREMKESVNEKLFSKSKAKKDSLIELNF